MKIDNSRIFTADIYEVIPSSKNRKLREIMEQVDEVFGSYSYDDRKTNTGMVVIYFKNKGYVPIGYVENMLQYLSIKLNSNVVDERVLQVDPGFLPTGREKFIKNIQPLFSYPGKTSLKELIGIQKLQNDRNNTYSGGMEIM